MRGMVYPQQYAYRFGAISRISTPQSDQDAGYTYRRADVRHNGNDWSFHNSNSIWASSHDLRLLLCPIGRVDEVVSQHIE